MAVTKMLLKCYIVWHIPLLTSIQPCSWIDDQNHCFRFPCSQSHKINIVYCCTFPTPKREASFITVFEISKYSHVSHACECACLIKSSCSDLQKVKDSWRVVNHRDIIPTVPRLMGYCHVAQPLYLAAASDLKLALVCYSFFFV